MPFRHNKPVSTFIRMILAFFVSYGFYSNLSISPHLPIETPRLMEGETYLHHVAYGFVYDETHEQAPWID